MGEPLTPRPPLPHGRRGGFDSLPVYGEGWGGGAPSPGGVGATRRVAPTGDAAVEVGATPAIPGGDRGAHPSPPRPPLPHGRRGGFDSLPVYGEGWGGGAPHPLVV